jgi:hypothetical protein
VVVVVVAEDAAWCSALASRFYREEFANRPVYLCVDEESLAEVAREEGLPAECSASEVTSEIAVSSLARAVRPRVRVSEPLWAWTQDASAWRRNGHNGPPPFLSLLAITVLAATSAGGRGDRGYYRRLNDLIGLPGHAMPRDFDSDIQQLWRCLNEWLADVERGQRGLPTATNANSAQPNIAWALSQTVLRPADRARLPQWFSSLGLHPGQEVDGDLLVRALRRSGMVGYQSRRLTQVLDDAALSESLAAALASELTSWDGTLRDESGRRALQLLLTYHERRRTFGIAVRTPPDLARQKIEVERSAPVSLGESGDLQPLSVPVTADLLDGASLSSQLLAEGTGAEVTAQELRLTMTHSDVRVLTPDDGLACWVEVRPAEQHRRHLVVVRSALAQSAVAVMSELAQSPPRRTSVPCPSGWVGYEYEPVRSGSVDGPLAALNPRGGEILALVGGLAVSARSHLYLSAGAPDVLFDLSNGGTALEVDGLAVARAGAAGRLRLAGRGLTEGTHEINVGGAHLTLRLVDEHAVGPMACSLGTRLRHETSSNGRSWIVPLPGEPLSAFEDSAAEILVQGASTQLSVAASLLATPKTAGAAQARAGGQHYALGDGRVAARVLPQPPGWLLELNPKPVPHMVDLDTAASGLSFVPRWYLRVGHGRSSVVPAGSPSVTELNTDAPETGNVWGEVLRWLTDVAVGAAHAVAWADWMRGAAPLADSSP